MTEQSSSEQPEAIGPYRIRKPLGEGGMSIVYLAEQEEPVRRSVALKILKPGMDSRQVVARFESERQALAVLDHPNIATIHDGGVSENGRPYFVMEHVDGLPITEFCDRNQLATGDRLRLFADVCRAVQHAHLKGLIHRDLKPSNILVGLVDGEPQPKIIDFGIAKATETPLTEKTQHTRVGQFIGTPQYMSPEQTGLSDEDIDTRADVYSLGVVLYELLAGTLPLDLSAVRDIALPAVIRDKVPPTPSTRFTALGSTRDTIAGTRKTSAQELSRQLKGDLDWIVMRAIEKDRTRRYETVNALAADCERYLNRQPVLARPPSAGYLLRRFVQRNRGAVTAASIALLAILAGAVTATVGYLRAVEAERVAQQEAETATQISDFLVSLFEVSDPSEARGNSVTAREVLDSAAERIDDTLAGEPEVLSNLKFTIAHVYSNLGLFEDAQPLAEDALGLRRSLDSEPDLLANSLDQLGNIRAHLGDPEAATRLHEEALDIRGSLGQETKYGYVNSLVHLATAAYLRSDMEGSRDHFLRAAELVESMEQPNAVQHAEIVGGLGVVYDQLGDFEQAEIFKRQAATAFDELFGPVHPRSATARNNLALTLNRLGRPADAAAEYRKSLEAYRQLYPDGHPDTANALNNLAQLLLRMNVLDEAEPLQRDSLAMFTAVFGEEHTQVATAKTNLGRILFAAGRLDEAESTLRQALGIQTRVLAPDHRRIFIGQEALAAVLIEQGNFSEGKELASSAWQYFRELYGDEHWRSARASSVFASALVGESRFDTAESLLTEALPRITAGLGEDHPATADTIRSLVALYEASGREDLATDYRRRLGESEP